jgi:mono/diheme cytochrome c family protein/ketosteroid isomerase-like protein
MKTIRALIVLIIVGLGAAVAYAYSGWYDVSVGTGHNPVTQWYLDTLRDRSVAERAADIQVPALDDPDMIQAGSLHYEEGCAGCHGKPGQESADVFDPRPPELARRAGDPAATYWIIQNGIKLSAMPIKGRGHSEEEVWSMVAFLQKLPELTPGEYKAMVEAARAEGGHQHSHDGEEESDRGEEGDEEAGHAHETPDDPVATVDAFHHALAEGDRDAALALLHENATILEGGNLQTRDAYASGHLDGDMAFMQQVDAETLSRDVSADDSQATVTTRTRMTGEYEGNPVDTVSLETAALVATDSGWRISSLVWSQPESEAQDQGEDPQGADGQD